MRLFHKCFIIGLVYLCSCSHDDDYPTAPADDGYPTAPVGTMMATINRPSPEDEPWQSTEALARKGNSYVSIIGSDGDEAFELTIMGGRPGTYKIELGTVGRDHTSLTWRPAGGVPYSTTYVSRLK